MASPNRSSGDAEPGAFVPDNTNDSSQKGNAYIIEETSPQRIIRMLELAAVIPAIPFSIALDITKAAPPVALSVARELGGGVLRYTAQRCIVSNIVDKKAQKI